MATALQSTLKEEVGNILPESLTSSMSDLPLLGLKDKASKFLPNPLSSSKTKPSSGNSKNKSKTNQQSASKANKFLGSAFSGIKSAASGSLPIDILPENLDPSEFLESSAEAVGSSASNFISAGVPEDLNPSNMLKVSTAPSGKGRAQRSTSKSLTTDVLPKGFDPSKFLSPSHSQAKKTSSSKSPHSKKGSKSESKQNTSSSKSLAKGFFGSALNGIKKVASQGLPEDLLPEGLDPSNILNSAKSTLSQIKESAEEALDEADFPDTSDIFSNSEDNEEEDDEEKQKKSSRSPARKPARNKEKNYNSRRKSPGPTPSKSKPPKKKKVSSNSSGGGMRKAVSTSVLNDRSRDYLSPCHSPSGSGEEDEVDNADIYLGGGVRKFSSQTVFDPSVEEQLIGKVNRQWDDSGMFLDVTLVGTSRRPSVDPTAPPIIKVEDEPIKEMEEEEIKKPPKRCCRIQRLTLGFTMLSTFLVSLNSFGSIGINSVMNGSLKSIQRSQKKSSSNSKCNSFCEVDEFRNRFYLVNSSLLSLAQQIQSQPGFATLAGPGETFNNPIMSCKALRALNPSLPSGFYWLSQASGSPPIRRYCDMALTCGGVTGGWMRVTQLDTRDITSACPGDFRIQEDKFSDYDPLNRACSLRSVRTCVIKQDQAKSCGSASYHPKIVFDKVCGRVIGYQYGNLTGFHDITSGGSSYFDASNTSYVDGVSLTYGDPAQHIWTFAAASNQQSENMCPCGNTGFPATPPPSFVGRNYFCDSAVESGTPEPRVYPVDPLWEGLGCNQTLTDCCSFNKPPWFYRSLQSPVTGSIHLTACREQQRARSDLGIQIIDILVQ